VILYPQSHGLILRLAFLRRRTTGLPVSVLKIKSGLGATYTPTAFRLRDPIRKGVHLATYLLVQALASVFGLFWITMLQTVVHICSPYHSSLAPIRMTLTEISLSYNSLTVSLGYIVPKASHKSVTRNACFGRLLVATH